MTEIYTMYTTGMTLKHWGGQRPKIAGIVHELV